MVPSLSIAIALFSFVALIDGNTLHGFNHSLDCSKFKRDFDVIRSFPFTVQVNPVVTTDKTYAVINTASQIEELTIYQENYLPLDVFCLTNLQVLRVVGTPFAPHYEFDGLTKGTGLSPLVARLNRLRTLSLVNTTASYLPPQAIGSLTDLTVLRVDGCGLRELPSTLANLTNLQELKLAKNSLSSLPDGRSLSAFSKLRVLDMSHNRLRDFVDIYLIPSRQVSTMDFSYNQIDYVPPEIGQFYLNLYYLYLNDNKMSYFPTDIFRLIYLKRADFQRNPLSAEEIALVKTRFRNSITNCLLNI